jgi:hypothetical protein
MLVTRFRRAAELQQKLSETGSMILAESPFDTIRGAMNRLTAVAVVLFALAGCSDEGEGNDDQASGGGNETESRCLEVHPQLLRNIETGLTTEGKGTLRDGQAVRSKDYEKVWFVAAELDASGRASMC